MRRIAALGLIAVVAATAVPATAQVTSSTAAYAGTLVTHQPATRPANTAVAYRGFRPTYQVSRVGFRAGEPTLGVDRTGKAFFAAGALHANPVGTVSTPLGSLNTQVQKAQFIASTDGGRTWGLDQATLVADQGDGHPHFFDPYVYVDPDTGRVFQGTLTNAAGSYFDFRDERGAAWTRTEMYVPGVNDHETVFAGPAPRGITTTDPAFRKVVYYCVNQLVDAACARSTDGGRTFVPTASIAYVPTTSGGPDGDQGDVRQTSLPGGVNGYCEGLTGHGQADSTGRIFLPWPCFGPWVGVSSDAGDTWHAVRLAQGTGIGTSPRAGTTSMAVDAADNLYYVWWDQTWFVPYLSTSRDHGATWSTPRMVAPPGVRETNLITIGAGAAGRVVMTFVGTTDADQSHADRRWDHYTVISTDALSNDPTFLSSITSPDGDPVHRGACQGPCAGMLDFLDEPTVAPDAHGTVWAPAVDTCTGDCAGPRGTGAQATDSQGFVVRQLTGPWLSGPLLGSPERGVTGTPGTAKPRPTHRQPTHAQAPSSGLAATGGQWVLPALLLVGLGLLARRPALRRGG
jgi:hypothetical protein